MLSYNLRDTLDYYVLSFLCLNSKKSKKDAALDKATEFVRRVGNSAVV